jgi:hypothetical protein
MGLAVILHHETYCPNTPCNDADDGIHGALSSMLDLHQNSSATWTQASKSFEHRYYLSNGGPTCDHRIRGFPLVEKQRPGLICGFLACLMQEPRYGLEDLLVQSYPASSWRQWPISLQ